MFDQPGLPLLPPDVYFAAGRLMWRLAAVINAHATPDPDLLQVSDKGAMAMLLHCVCAASA